jgi:8-amino-7-oxononanoate synthase
VTGPLKEDPLGFLDGELEALRSQSLLRTPFVRGADGLEVLCSNDYLGYGKLPLAEGWGGAGASPLVSGYFEAHARAEDALASWLGVESALLFSSGYAANVGTVSALVGRGDLVVSDALNHASIIDGCRLSRAEIAVVPHLSVDAIATALQKGRAHRRRLVVVESYFSMDADGPDLRRLAEVCTHEQAILMVDEAHALGLEGSEGRGRCAAAGLMPDVLVGTLGKALGLHGAFVAGKAALRSYLWNRARSLVFSTGVSPAVAGTVPRRIDRLRGDDAGREKVWALAVRTRARLTEAGFDVRGAGPIIPIVVGESATAARLAGELREQGWLLQAIRPPTVPTGTARLRMTVTAETDPSIMDQVTGLLIALRREDGLGFT